MSPPPRTHFKSGDHIPVAASGIVLELSDRIPGRYAVDTPLFRRDVFVARYDERPGVRSHCTEDGALMLKTWGIGVLGSAPWEGLFEMLGSRFPRGLPGFVSPLLRRIKHHFKLINRCQDFTEADKAQVKT